MPTLTRSCQWDKVPSLEAQFRDLLKMLNAMEMQQTLNGLLA